MVSAAAVLTITVAVAQTAPGSFEVASVKLVKDRECATRYEITPTGMNYCNANLTYIVAMAYQLSITRVVTAPKAMYDKSVLDENVQIIASANRMVTREQIYSMLKTLLVDRFKLAVHRELRPETIYKLVVTGSRLNLHPTSRPSGPSTFSPDANGYGFTNQTMADFCRIFLTGFLRAQVTDETGLKGFYDFLLKADFPEGQTSRDKVPEAAQVTISSVIANIQELGLKLQADKGSGEYLIIDHVERPDAN
jgi:uncharacterized protein (TIGR03435 family)